MTTSIYSEHKELLGTGLATADTIIIGDIENTPKWNTPLAILAKYANISTLILSVLPVILSISFLGVNAANIFFYVRGGPGTLTVHIIGTIGSLILVVIVLNISPAFFEGLQGVYATVDGRLTVMERFMGILRLVLEFVPVVFVAGLTGVYTLQGGLLANRERGSM